MVVEEANESSKPVDDTQSAVQKRREQTKIKKH